MPVPTFPSSNSQPRRAGRRVLRVLATAAGVALACAALVTPAQAQITERKLPAEWQKLVQGGRFMDRFLPMQGSVLSADTWGAEGVVPRFVDNGVEDRKYSYWGGNVVRGEDGKFHLFVCGWLESSAKGHHEWANSDVFHCVSDTAFGPFKPVKTIGKGHNPEVYRAKNGQCVLDVSGGRVRGRYVADKLDGPWQWQLRVPAHSNRRDRADHFGDNFTFAAREDGSVLMVPRNGSIWLSRDGLDTFHEIGDRCYPKFPGAYEDPVLWRDNVQYHLIVNDWLGRIAWYLRSKDGVKWVIDPGEAYVPGVSKHPDGRVEKWFKYERPKVLQDAHGRAIQMNLAVIDVLKNDDKAGDNHSSKNISVPLNPGALLTILDAPPVSAKDSRTIRVKIAAETGFDPHADVDVPSLRFGASTEVNFGRGAKAVASEKAGADLIVTFDGATSGITPDEFAPKLLGKTTRGGLFYGYARLPGVKFIEPILSGRIPTTGANAGEWRVEVQNFGQVASEKATLVFSNSAATEFATAEIPPLDPYAKAQIVVKSPLPLDGKGLSLTQTILDSDGRKVATFRYGKDAPTAKPDGKKK